MAYVGAVLLSRWTLILFNVLISYVGALAVIDVIMMIVHHRHFAVQVEVMDGMGVILIGYGVALEERKALRELAGPLSRINRDWEAAIDSHCHSQGVLLLVFGLFVEMCIACIEIPNHVVNTAGIEKHLLALSIFFLTICIVVMIVYSLRMLLQRKRWAAPPWPTTT